MTFQSIPPIAQQTPTPASTHRTRWRWIAVGVVMLGVLVVAVPAYLAFALIQGPGQRMVRTIQELTSTQPLPATHLWLVGNWQGSGGETLKIERDSTISWQFGGSSGKSFLFIKPDGIGATVTDPLREFRIDFQRGRKEQTTPTLLVDGKVFRKSASSSK